MWAMNDVKIDRQNLLDRFLAYARIETTSDKHSESCPSTSCQWDLLKRLKGELEEMRVPSVELNADGYLIAALPGNAAEAPEIGFMAHVDTSPDVSGRNVSPRVIEHYDGKTIILNEKFSIDPADCPTLSERKGETLVVTDGNTLLGADDKAGVAEIMAAVEYLCAHPDYPHGPVTVIFTPDEEIGRGMDRFPIDMCRPYCSYTMDGSEQGVIEAECFHAYGAKITFTGQSIHPGSARGKLVNAVTLAAKFLALLPGQESPEATDGRFGFYCPVEVRGSIESASCELILRDFDADEIERRCDVVRSLARTVETLYPGASIEVELKRQYRNMAEYLDGDPRVLSILADAVVDQGIEPEFRLIRGGTDGSRFSEMGVPTPNVFTGGVNYHSRREWVSLDVMEKAVGVILNIIARWSTEVSQ